MVQSPAERLGMPNNPPAQARVNITETIRLLECIRATGGVLRGVPRHAGHTHHQRLPLGGAEQAAGGKRSWRTCTAMCRPPAGQRTADEFGEVLRNGVLKDGPPYDQIIIKSKTARWVHVGYKRTDGKAEKTVFHIESTMLWKKRNMKRR